MNLVNIVRALVASQSRTTSGSTFSIQLVAQGVLSENIRCMSTQICAALFPKGPKRNPVGFPVIFAP
jgi:hypothetical protein